MESLFGYDELPLSVRIRTVFCAISILSKRLGVTEAVGVGLQVLLGELEGKPFSHLPPAESRSELLSRRQVGPAILLYRALVDRLGAESGLAALREVIVASTRIFLGHAIGHISKEKISAQKPHELREYAENMGRRFFNATIIWEEISSERLCFNVTHCLFPDLCRKAGAEEVASLLCEGDAFYFHEVLGTIDLERPYTLASGGASCPFRLVWRS